MPKEDDANRPEHQHRPAARFGDGYDRHTADRKLILKAQPDESLLMQKCRYEAG